MFIDNCTAVTVISKDLFERIKDNTTRCKNTISHAVSADGTILSVSNCGEVEVLINNVALKTKFHVMPQVPHQRILGMDFFKRHNVVLDFQEGNVIIKGPRKVITPDKIQVPAQSEMFLLAQVDCDLLNSTQGEFLADSTLSNLGLVVAKSVGTVENLLVPILVLNPSDNVITIRKRTVIGKFKPLSMEDNVLVINTPDLAETRSKAQTNQYYDILVNIDDEFWPIEKLIKGRRRKDKLEYLVKWKGCTSKDNSWVSYDDLNDEAIKYLANNNVPITGKQDTSPAM